MADRKEIVRNVARLALLFVAFGSGISVIAVISTLKAKFGECVLLAEIRWNDPDYQCVDDNGVELKHCAIVPDTPGSCSFLIKYQGTACLVSCIWFIYFIIKLITQNEYRRPIPLIAISSIIYGLMSLISACILHAALHKLCSGLLKEDVPNHNTCKDFEARGSGMVIRIITVLTSSGCSMRRRLRRGFRVFPGVPYLSATWFKYAQERFNHNGLKMFSLR